MKKKKTANRAKTGKISLGKPPIALKKIPANKRPKPFPIVGFGASAGGIEAFTSVLENLDPKLGMAYVLIMHLSPNHKSALAKIMQSKTKMPVQTVRNGMEVKANNVYVIPPKTFMSLVDGHLKLAPRSATSIGNYAIDYFLTALASVYKNNAIGVILSGTATDGTLGLKAVKAEGGITFAQDDTAEFSGMPSNAYDSGYVDLRLSAEGIAKELSRLVKSAYTRAPSEKINAGEIKEIKDHPEDLKAILSTVREKSGIDFLNQYKNGSINRRVMRRMVLNDFDSLKDYHALLRKNPREIDLLYNDFLINVTSFFRDPDFYKTLIEKVFPLIARSESNKPADTIRIWVAGCATGEEAYSIVITLIEYLKKRKLEIPIQVFASDLDSEAIEKARSGIYSVSALQGISPTQLKQYFVKVNHEYQIIKSVREFCIFSQHNLLKDPPFSRIDLISCQNVLIYLEMKAQRRILETFHYSLKPKGFLFLGKSETIGASSDLFEQLDKKVRLFSRKRTDFPQLGFTKHAKGKRITNSSTNGEGSDGSVDTEINKLLLSRFVYPSVVVNKNFVIVHFYGITSPYLEPVTGKASFNILKMVKANLVIDLGSLLQQAKKTERTAIKEGIPFSIKKVLYELTIEVVPRKDHGEILFLVVFRENVVLQFPKTVNGGLKKNGIQGKKIVRLEEELVQSREVIRTTNEEYETTYEELQANNEEVLSTNEELQSVNEELESSKEELQSSNEELTTTNEELHKRNHELHDSQQELLKVNEQLEQFAFVSSHDLQEPLRKILTFSDLLSGPEADLNEYAKTYSDKINASASRMSTLIKDLLSFSRIVNGSRKKVIKVDLNELLTNVLEDFELVIKEKKATINVSALPIIIAEPIQMEQLFHNLISNALKFSEQKPVISISAKLASPADYSTHPLLVKKRKYNAIRVSDNGLGFEQKYAEKIFTLFQRLNDHETAKGNGLGLALCKKIVEDHEGIIEAKGKIHKGATFTVFLPIN